MRVDVKAVRTVAPAFVYNQPGRRPMGYDEARRLYNCDMKGGFVIVCWFDMTDPYAYFWAQSWTLWTCRD